MDHQPNDKTNHSGCVFNFGAVEDAFYVIGGKWKLKIIIALYQDGSQRFNELQRLVPGISGRVLSNELKDLEMNGFVTRQVHAERTPVVVEYIPTEYCLSLKTVVKALWDWGVDHKKKLTARPS
jgi:DNA-binding HxlR family transcriptional regulator